MFLSTIFRTV